MKIQHDIPNSVTADYIVTEVLSDTYDDAGILREKCFRWLFRVWTRLNYSFVRTSRRMILPIAPGTRTMMLPYDYQDFIFLGAPDGCGNWLPIAVNRNLMPTLGIENNNLCRTCGQVDLCSLEMQETEEPVVIAGNTYKKTTSRVIAPDGSYTEEVTEPVAKYTDSYFTGVEMQTSRQVVCQLDKSCSTCVPATPGNINLLSSCGCTDLLCCCSNSLLPYDVKPSNAHYNLFEQEGFIQFSPGTCIDQALLWYVSSGKCINGTYYFPLQVMEVLISGVYYKSIAKKKNIAQAEKDRARREYGADRKEVMREFTRLSYMEWVEMIDQIPRIPTIGSEAPLFDMPVGRSTSVAAPVRPPAAAAPPPPLTPSPPATPDLGLRHVPYTITQSGKTITVQELGSFAFLIMGAAPYDMNYISQSGKDLTWKSGAPLFQAGTQISIYFNP